MLMQTVNRRTPSPPIQGSRLPGSGWRALSSLFLAAILLSVGHTEVLAQTPDRLEEIRVVGNRRIVESTILYYIQSKENDPYNASQILRDYRSLLNTDFFRDLKVKRMAGETGWIIIFEVKERPLIRSIEYEGMKSFKKSEVLEKFRDMRVGITVDSPFNESKIPRARRALRVLLQTNGRPLATIEALVENVTTTSVKLTFRINEGPKVRIGNIDFEGNTVFEDKELRKALELTKIRGAISLFKGQDKFILEKMEYDIHSNMLAKYRANGYINARAGEPKTRIVEAPQGWLWGFRKTKQQYFLTIPIEEGEQYRYAGFEVEGVRNFEEQLVYQLYRIEEGEIVNFTAIKDGTENLKKLYSRFGYLDVEVQPNLDPDEDNKTVQVRVNVEEGKQYIVHRIRFAGNTKTRDKVLRREFLLEEQQVFNGDLLEFSVLRLNQLGFFERIEEKDYEVSKKPEEAEVEVLVKVKERSMQMIGLTGGVSGISGSFVGVNYTTNNFRGLGQQINVSLLTGTRTANYTFTFTEPYLLGSKISLGASIFSQRFRFDTYSAFFGLISPSENIPLFTRITTGFEVNGSYPLGRWTRFGLGYTMQTIRIRDIDDLFVDFALNQLIGFTPGGSAAEAQRGIIRSQVTPSIVYNTKDSFFNASRGTNLTVQVQFAGGPLGGSFNVIRPYIEYQKFLPDRYLSKGRNTFALRAQLIHIVPFGELATGGRMSVPFFERIFSGGEYTFRGFDIQSITPWAISRTPLLDGAGLPLIDPGSGLPAISEQIIPVGADTSLILTGEYRIPIAGPLQLVAFADFGTTTVLLKENLSLFGPSTFINLQEQTNNIWRASTGAEVQFLLPVINQPFRLIFAYNPLRMDETIVLGGVRFPMREPKTNIKFTVGYTF